MIPRRYINFCGDARNNATLMIEFDKLRSLPVLYWSKSSVMSTAESFGRAERRGFCGTDIAGGERTDKAA